MLSMALKDPSMDLPGTSPSRLSGGGCPYLVGRGPLKQLPAPPVVCPLFTTSASRRIERFGLGVLCIGVLAFAWQNVNINEKLVFTLPYLLTLLVLAFSSERLRPPAASGIVWRKGQG